MALKTPFTAPVFRSRPDIKHGFLGGGYWKYSAKPSNITPLDMEIMNDQNGGEHTIEDDNIIAGQDVVAGLVRMGILPRFRYLLEVRITALGGVCVCVFARAHVCVCVVQVKCTYIHVSVHAS